MSFVVARLASAVVLTGAFLSALSSAAQTPLTLAEAQRRAVERSRQIAAHELGIQASREMAVAAGERPDPMLRLGVDNLPIDGPDRFSLSRDFMTMQRIGVMQELTRSEKLRLRSERFQLEARKGEAEKQNAIAAVQRGTALAWLDRYYAEAMAAIIDEQMKEARLEIEAAESAYRGGRGNQSEVFAAQSALVALEDRASEFRRRAQTASAALARWIDEDARLPLAGKPDIEHVRLHLHDLPRELAQHPEIEAMSRQAEMAAAEARLAKANRTPDWTVEVMYQQRGSAYSNMVSVGVSVPLPWDRPHRQDRELAAKLAMADQAAAQRDDTLRAHVAEVRGMLAEWQNGRERRARYDERLIPLARERTQAAVAAYRGGKATLTEVLAARRNEIEVRMQALQLEMDTARIWAQLNYLIPVESTR
jgi:outer membrane protein TolC